MKTIISSLDNARLRLAAKLTKDRKHRRKEGLWVVEGARMALEVLKESLNVKFWMIEEGWGGDADSIPDQILREIQSRGDELVRFKKGLLREAADTCSPQGVIVVFDAPTWEEGAALKKPGPIVLLDQIQDPGNLGVIARAAEGAGASCLLLARGTADPGNPKALRASAGSLLRLPVVTAENPVLSAREAGFKVVATASSAVKSYSETDLTVPFALLLGQEGSGLQASAMDSADFVVKIPTEGRLESLNVATAASIILFEAARQRRANSLAFK